MCWRDRRRSDNIEDRQNQPGRIRAPFGDGGMRLPLCGKSGLFILVVILVAGYYGIDLTSFITGGSNINSSQHVNYQPTN
ncbi:MAG TPA: neutral zinc metallopeptidase [Arsenophonus sp.]